MNEERFSGKGAVYNKYRPAYPASAIEKAASLSDGDVLADIGSGTGIFTRLIAPYFKNVFAVEPNADMRIAAEKSYTGTNIISVSGTAENTGLDSGSVSLVTAAQAFHWFDKEAFKTECVRILKPGGQVVLIWNEKDKKSALINELYELNRSLCPSFSGFSAGFDPGKNTRAFFGEKMKALSYENCFFYDEESFVGRNLSSSYAPIEGDKNYEAYVSGLGKLFEKYKNGKTVEFPYITNLYFGGLE